MMKKILVLMMTIAIIVLSGLQTSAFATDFPDVPYTHINYDAIMRLTKLGVVAGYEDGTFGPKKEITRTEFCALMSRTLGYDKDTYKVKEIPFSDVPENYWGRAYISFCYEKGLINGMGDNLFAPADKVTVAQVVKMVVCAAERESEASRHTGKLWYSGYMKVADLYGLLAENNQEPGDNAFRSNAAQLVYNLIESGLVPETDTDVDVSVEEPEQDKPAKNEDEDDPAEEDNEKTDDEEEELSELEKEYAKKDFSDVKVILVDAGHNYSGKDIGAQIEEKDLKEETITWEIADRLRKKLEKMGYTVVMTREEVTDNIEPTSQLESLQARVDLAHRVSADLFISIHCNMGGGTGTETYCFEPGGYSERLAKLVQKNITENTELRDRGVKNANFYVIKNTLMPAILVETAFMDNESDAEVITSAKGQNQIAQAIADSVKKYDSMDPLVIKKAVGAEDTEKEE